MSGDQGLPSPLRLGSAAAGGAQPAAGSPTPRADRAPARGEKSAFEMLIRKGFYEDEVVTMMAQDCVGSSGSSPN
jgi:hypothetical protein